MAKLAISTEYTSKLLQTLTNAATYIYLTDSEGMTYNLDAEVSNPTPSSLRVEGIVDDSIMPMGATIVMAELLDSERVRMWVDQEEVTKKQPDLIVSMEISF